MLKHLPDDVLETFQHELTYSKKKVIIKEMLLIALTIEEII